MSRVVLDASALLALLNLEQGHEAVAKAVASGAVMSAVNLSEVVAKLSEAGVPEAVIHEALDLLGLEIIAFDTQQAYYAGLLRTHTKHAGLSLGDRACLALAKSLGLPALTTDRIWENLALDVIIQVLR